MQVCQGEENHQGIHFFQFKTVCKRIGVTHFFHPNIEDYVEHMAAFIIQNKTSICKQICFFSKECSEVQIDIFH